MDAAKVIQHIGFQGTEAEFDRLLKNMFLQAELMFALLPWYSGGCAKSRRNAKEARLSADVLKFAEVCLGFLISGKNLQKKH